jgi:putative endonuclease
MTKFRIFIIIKGLGIKFKAKGEKILFTKPLPPLFEFCFLYIMMYYVYIIKQKNGELYIGYTSDLRRRIKEHQAKPENLVYYEAYKAKEDATKREKQIKKYKSAWGQLKKRIIKSRI